MTNLIDLSKKAKVVLEKKQIFGEKAQIVVALDISYSMQGQYSSGVVQELTERLLGIGLNMDLDKSIDVYGFGQKSHSFGSVDESNYQGYIANKRINLEGNTNYAGVMADIIKASSAKKGGFFKKKEVADVPTLVFFITDGDNSDKVQARKLIKDSSNEAIFWQFVGIGHASFNFLKELDDMSGRFLDNADFFEVNDLRNISDEDLYNKLLNEYPQWIKDARVKGILK